MQKSGFIMARLIIVIVADTDTIYVLFQTMTGSSPSTMEKPDIETVRAVVHKILVMYPYGVTREELLSKILYFIMLTRLCKPDPSGEHR